MGREGGKGDEFGAVARGIGIDVRYVFFLSVMVAIGGFQVM